MKTVLWLVLLLSPFALLPSARSAADNNRLTDSLACANPTEERSHHLAFGGAVAKQVRGDWVGGHDLRRLARTVQGKGSWIAYRVRVNSKAVTTLEVEEVYGRDRDVRGYLILVDGRKVYLRTWQGSGAGLIHYFVQILCTDTANRQRHSDG